MDQRDGIPPLGLGSYYTQKENAGMGLQGSSGMSSVSNSVMQFQSPSRRNLFGSSSSSSVDISSSMAHHGFGSPPPGLGFGSPPPPLGMGLQGSSGMSSVSNPSMQAQNLWGSSSSVDNSLSMAPHGIGSPPPGLGVGSPPALGAGLPPGMMQGEPARRKRGRPRKYGSGMSMASTSMTSTPSTSAPERTTQRKKGRPLGTGKKQQQSEFISSGHTKFNPYVLNVNAGEDIKGKILEFAQGQQDTVVISATGAVSTVNIRILRSDGIVPVTYEGHFNILSLTGSFTRGVNAPHAPVGCLNVTLSGADGSVLGGGVEAFIYARSPVQVVVASLSPRIPKAKTIAGGTSGGSKGHSGGKLGTPATV